MRKSRRVLTVEEKLAIEQLYDDGYSFAAIGRQLNRHGRDVSRYLTRVGLYAPRRRRTAREEAAIVRCYERRVRVEDIIGQFNLRSRGDLYRILRRNNVPLRYPQMGRAFSHHSGDCRFPAARQRQREWGRISQRVFLSSGRGALVTCVGRFPALVGKKSPTITVSYMA